MKKVMCMLITLIVMLAVLETGLAEESTSIQFQESEYSIAVGKSVTIKTTLSPKKMKLVWTSSDETIAIVNAKGVVKGIAEGIVTITAKSDDGKAESHCTVSVVIPVKTMKLSEKSIKMEPGTDTALIVTIAPESATNKTLKWTSSDETIVTVDENGVVTANSYGSAQITAETTDGSKKKASILVTVTISEIVIGNKKLGDFGKKIEKENGYGGIKHIAVYYVPAGKYKATNISQYATSVYILKDSKPISKSKDIKIMGGESKTISIKENEYLWIVDEAVEIKLEKK